MPDTIRLRAADVAELCSFNCQGRAQIADREADAAKATTKPSVKIKKTEMQPRRNFHGNGDRLGNAIVQAQSPKIVQLGGFFECEYGSTVRYPNSVGNRAGNQRSCKRARL